MQSTTSRALESLAEAAIHPQDQLTPVVSQPLPQELKEMDKTGTVISIFEDEIDKLSTRRKNRQISIEETLAKMHISIVDLVESTANPPMINSDELSPSVILSVKQKLGALQKKVNAVLESLQRLSLQTRKFFIFQATWDFTPTPVFTPEEFFILWHVLDECEKNLPSYLQQINEIDALLTENNQIFKAHLKLRMEKFSSLCKHKKDLKKIDELGLYIYRLQQLFLSKQDRKIDFLPEWEKGENVFMGRGFKSAIQDYREQFRRFLLPNTLIKDDSNTVFEPLTKISKILSLEEKPSFSNELSQALPVGIKEHIWEWLKEGIEGVTKMRLWQNGAIDEELDNFLLGFTTLVRSEQLLKETMSLVESLAIRVKQKTGSYEALKQFKATDFSRCYQQQPKSVAEEEKITPHDAIVAAENKYRKKSEQARREQDALKNLAEYKDSFTRQLAEDNERKEQIAKQAKKTELLALFMALPKKKRGLLKAFLNPETEAHNEFKEKNIIEILTSLGLSEPTSKGYKVGVGSNLTSSHRDHANILDANFVRNVRKIFIDLDITVADFSAAAKWRL